MTTNTYGVTNAISTSLSPANVLTTYSFDGAGSRTLENANGVLTTYVWDGEFRQTLWLPSTGVPNTYTYAADNLRRSTNSSSGLVYNVWDDMNLLRTTNSSGVTQQRFTDFPGYWGGLTSMRDLTTLLSSFYGFDLNGNTRDLVNALGAITDQYWSTAFGYELNSTGTTNNPFRFDGRDGGWRRGANKTELRARIMEMLNAIFMSRDPIGFDGGDWNLYRYVMNNPLRTIDPSGLMPTWLCCLIVSVKKYPHCRP